MPPRTERRRHLRHGVSGLRAHLPVAGRVVNASVGGLALEATGRLTPGWSYAFKLGEGRRTIRIPGRVAWCRPLRTQPAPDGASLPVFAIGIELAGSIWDPARPHLYP